MNHRQFDGLLRALPTGSRRGLLAALAGGVLASRQSNRAEAGKRKKRKKRKKRQAPLQLNAFGCVDVGKACQGNDTNCCSGICAGKKPKLGEKDTSRCVAHNESTCLAGQHPVACGGAATVTCTTTGQAEGACVTTTGNAPYCFAGGGVCFQCTKDTDCIPFCGPPAACVRCASDCPETGGAVCVGLGFCNNNP